MKSECTRGSLFCCADFPVSRLMRKQRPGVRGALQDTIAAIPDDASIVTAAIQVVPKVRPVVTAEAALMAVVAPWPYTGPPGSSRSPAI